MGNSTTQLPDRRLISQAEAFRFLGRANVRDAVLQGLLSPCRVGSRVYYDRVRLEAVETLIFANHFSL